MNEDPAPQFVAVQHRPAATASRIRVTLAFPREIDSILAVNTLKAAIKTAANGAECEVARDYEIDAIGIPFVHLNVKRSADHGTFVTGLTA